VVTGGDLEVAQSLAGASITASLALAVLEPVDAVAGAPGAEDKGHASLEIFAYGIITAASDGVSAAFLGKLNGEGVESISGSGSEVDLGVERSGSVNLPCSLTVSAFLLLLEVDGTRATSITPVVVALIVWLVTLVNGRPPRVQV